MPTDTELLNDIRERMVKFDVLLTDVTEAFPKNDIGKIDYDGHRRDHILQRRETDSMQDYKHGITKQILGWATGLLLAALSAGIFSKLGGS